MNIRDIIRRVLFWMLAIIAVSPAEACNVPVFRYALENWRPDAYRATIICSRELSESEREFVRGLELQRGAGLLNLVIETAAPDGVDQSIRDALPSDMGDAPWIVVQYPSHLHIEKAVWSGAFTSESLSQLVDSPVRKELVKRLVEGDTAVWLLLDGGDSEHDAAAALLLKEELVKLQQTLKLPELTDSPEDILRGSTPLRLSFSTIRVQRDDPAEQELVAMLLGSEPDLKELSEPMVFPVFGRGRALFGLVGAGISGENIRSSAVFLAGACSCQVKEQNPGFDLLIAANWTDLVSVAEPAEIASAAREPELVPIATGISTLPVAFKEPSAVSPSMDKPDIVLPLIGAFGAMFVLIASASFLIGRIRRSPLSRRDNRE